MSTATLPRTGLVVPFCPPWCAEDRCPDPGVVDHYSRIWAGFDHHDNAEWSIRVTQRVTDGVPGLARIDVNQAVGTYASVAEFMRALLAAEKLTNEINAELAQSRKAA